MPLGQCAGLHWETTFKGTQCYRYHIRVQGVNAIFSEGFTETLGTGVYFQ